MRMYQPRKTKEFTRDWKSLGRIGKSSDSNSGVFESLMKRHVRDAKILRKSDMFGAIVGADVHLDQSERVLKELWKVV
jgi:hypothetical protein